MDEKCIDNLLCIDNIIVEPIKFADKGHAGVLISGIDENPFEHNFTLKIFPNIDMSYLKNQIPNNLTENEVDLYKKDALKNIIVFLHELTHSFGYIKFLKYSTEKNNYTLLTKEDISKENYTFLCRMWRIDCWENYCSIWRKDKGIKPWQYLSL